MDHEMIARSSRDSALHLNCFSRVMESFSLPMWRAVLVAVLALAWITQSTTLSASLWADDLQFENGLPFRFGEYVGQYGALKDPASVAVDADGRIFIADTLHRRIAVVDRQGRLLQSLGEHVLVQPKGVAVDPTSRGALIVTDAATGNLVRLNRFDDSHIVLATPESAPMSEPHGIVVTMDRILVADARRDHIVVFHHNGEVASILGSHGSGPGQFNRVMDLAVDADGFIYVADTDNHRIQKFSKDGAFIKVWGQWGPFPGLFFRPTGITVHGSRVFVTDQKNHRIQTFTLDGSLRYQWGLHALMPREGEGKLHYPMNLAIAPTGDFCVIAEPIENRVQIIDVASDDLSESDVGIPMQPAIEQTHFGAHLHIDGNLLAIGEPETHRVYVFRIDREVPVIITQFGMQGRQFGRFDLVGAVHLDAATKRLWVVDRATRRILEFALNLDAEGEPRMQPYVDRMQRAFDLQAMLKTMDDDSNMHGAIDPIAIERHDSSLLVLDGTSQSVLAIDLHSRSLRWVIGRHNIEGGGNVAAAKPVSRLVDFAVDAKNQLLYVLDAGRSVINVYEIETFTPSDKIDLRQYFELEDPSAVAIDHRGGILISDREQGSIFSLSAQGDATQIGNMGSEVGSLWKPGELHVDDQGRIFVADFGNHRAQIFSRDGQWQASFGIGRAYTPRNRPARGG